MSNSVYLDKLPDNYTENYIDCGCNSKCFLVDNNTVFKMLNNPDVFEDNIVRLSKYKVPSFVFPKKLIYVKDKFVGYTMDYVEGTTLSDLNDALLKEYINQIIEFEYILVSISNKHIGLLDFKPRNVIYKKNNKFRVIDTDFYYLTNNKRLYQINAYQAFSTLLYPIIDIYDVRFQNKRLNYYRNLITEGRYLPSKFLLEILKEIRHNLKIEVNSINEAKEAIELIRK